MLIADRLWIPDNSQAILWDMDGVLLDTLGLDLTICNQLLHEHLGDGVAVSKEYIRSIFAYDPVEFWRLILKKVETQSSPGRACQSLDKILPGYIEARNTAIFAVNPGIVEILNDAKGNGIRMAVVSNNPTADVTRIISASGLIAYFEVVVGNDLKHLQKKPAPDTYIYAAELLNVPPQNSVVVEDSVLGLEAGHSARCFTVGVATGGESFESLENSSLATAVYSSFEKNRMSGQFGHVTHKQIHTPNDFVSHMIEHIAWRTGFQIQLDWHNNDWQQLGVVVGATIAKHQNYRREGVTLGMIDDGSAEVSIELSPSPAAEISVLPTLDRDWVLSLRCEQLGSARTLLSIIEGLSSGLCARIDVRICSFEDPHHSWEGVFRSIGIALGQMFTPPQAEPRVDSGHTQGTTFRDGLQIEGRSLTAVKVSRRTAESSLSVSVDLSGANGADCTFVTAPSVNVNGLTGLLKLVADEAGITFRLFFEAVALSSSHVVLEDTALVIGRALKEIVVLRMEHWGTDGAGSSLQTAEDLETQPIGVGISVEGRKFFKMVPFKESYPELRRRFIVGRTISNGLFSEDLDDFLDGLAGGLEASIIVHVREIVEPDQGWKLIFRHLGKALKGVFKPNPFRKGVPPGVKATLY